jgi:hypothetical protein
MYCHLHAGADMPAEYLDLVLCRDVYRCTPPELDEIDNETLEAHLVCLEAEAEVRRARG